MIFPLRETVFSDHDAVLSYLSIFAYLSKRNYQKNDNFLEREEKEMESKMSKWLFLLFSDIPRSLKMLISSKVYQVLHK